MKLGIGMAPWALGLPKDDQRLIARDAEAAGFDSLWVSEACGSDVLVSLGWLAACTERIGLGTAVLQIAARPAAMTAMSAAMLDALSNGRLRLGLGLPQVSQERNGEGHPPGRARDYVEVVRTALAGKRARCAGHSDVPGSRRTGKPSKSTITSARYRLPILLAAQGARNVALAGAIADGWISTFFAPEHAETMCAPLAYGAEATGREVADIAICPRVPICVTSDPESAREAMRADLRRYIGGMGSGAHGVDANLIDMVCICGPHDHVRGRLRAFAEAGVSTLILMPTASRPDQLRTQLRAIARAGADYLPTAARH